MNKTNATTLSGTVVSVKMQSTIVVEVVTGHKHKLYKKMIKRSKRFAVHVPDGMQAAPGDVVVIKETKPVSRTKYFVLVSKVNQ